MTFAGGRDPGLQPERTALAWSRTGLAVVVGSLLGLRLLVPQVGGAGLVLGGLGVAVGLVLLLAPPRRERRAAATGLRPGAGLIAATAAGCVLLGCAGVVVLLVGP